MLENSSILEAGRGLPSQIREYTIFNGNHAILAIGRGVDNGSLDGLLMNSRRVD